MKTIIAACLSLILISATAHADAPKWTMLPEESKIAIKGKQMGKDFDGYFKTFSADILFDANTLDQSVVTATVDMNSFVSGDKERDEAVMKGDWFDIARFPNAAFKADTFTKQDDTHFTAAGNLTIRGVSVPVSLPFELTITNGPNGHQKAAMKGKTSIDRSAFKLGTGDWADPSVVANEVTVEVTLAATKQLVK